LHGIDRDEVVDADLIFEPERRQANDLAAIVERGPAAVPVIDGGIGLHDVPARTSLFVLHVAQRAHSTARLRTLDNALQREARERGGLAGESEDVEVGTRSYA